MNATRIRTAAGLALTIALCAVVSALVFETLGGAGLAREPGGGRPADRNDDGDSGGDRDRNVDAEGTHAPYPEEAIERGLSGLQWIFPARTIEQQSLLALAQRGEWAELASLYHVIAAPDPHQFNRAAFEYVMLLRAVCAYVAARSPNADPHGWARHELLTEVGWRIGNAFAPLGRVGMFETDDGLVEEGLYWAAEWGKTDPGVEARLKELMTRDDSIGKLAARVWAHLFEGGEPPWRYFVPNIGGNVGGGGGPSGSGGFKYRRPPSVEPPDWPDVDPTGYTLADLPALIEMYESGDEDTRSIVARVVAHHRWPEAFDLAVRILADSVANIRKVMIAGLVDYGTASAFESLAARLAVEPEAALRIELVTKVCVDDSDAMPSLQRRMLVLAVRDEHDHVRGAAHRALAIGRVAVTDGLVDAMISVFALRPQRYEMCTVLRWLRDYRGLPGVRRAIEMSLSHTTDADDLFSAVDQTCEDVADSEFVDLVRLGFTHTHARVRAEAISRIASRFSDSALAALLDRCRHDRVDWVAKHAVTVLQPYIEVERTVRFTDDALAIGRRAVDEGVIELIVRAGDARYVRAYLVAHANSGAVHASNRRWIDRCSKADIHKVIDLIADYGARTLNFILIAILNLADNEPPDVVDRVARARAPFGDQLGFIDVFLRVADRTTLYQLMLARLWSGDLNAAAWFHVRFPRLAFPTDLVDCTPAKLARLIGSALGLESPDASALGRDYAPPFTPLRVFPPRSLLDPPVVVPAYFIEAFRDTPLRR